MLVIISSILVVAYVFSGHVLADGNFGKLWQPFEITIIGVGIGAFITNNLICAVQKVVGTVGSALTGSQYQKDDYIEQINMRFQFFKLAKVKQC